MDKYLEATIQAEIQTDNVQVVQIAAVVPEQTKVDKKIVEEKSKKAEKEPIEEKNDTIPEQPSTRKEEKEQNINPWSVEAGEEGVDYNKLIHTFGSSIIDQALIDRFERVTGKKAHKWLRRGMFFSHRDLNLILDAYEKKEKFFLYTGRGPSSDSLHLGHLIPFFFTKWLQETLNCPLVIQLTDDEKFLWKKLELDECVKMGRENAKDIISCGFDPKKTFIFSDMSYIGEMYWNIVRIQKCVTVNTVRAIFGFTEGSSIGQQSFPAVQAAPSFSSSFKKVLGTQKIRCLIPCAIDQDPYFRMTRDVALRLNEFKPALMHSKFIPALAGINTKMSASSMNSCIYVTDTPNMIKNKINRHAVSGGRETVEEHRRLGADLSKDIPYQYLEYFLDDDVELLRIREEYGAGRMLTGEVKQVLIKEVQKLIGDFQQRRSNLSEADVDEFFSIRMLDF